MAAVPLLDCELLSGVLAGRFGGEVGIAGLALGTPTTAGESLVVLGLALHDEGALAEELGLHLGRCGGELVGECVNYGFHGFTVPYRFVDVNINFCRVHANVNETLTKVDVSGTYWLYENP
jgi:hypothetical protein